MAEVTYKKMKIKGNPIIVDAAIRDDKGRNISGKLDELDGLINDSGFITLEDIPAIPTNTSDLVNDAGFITENDIPAVPTKVSELENDSGYQTESQVDDKVDKKQDSIDVDNKLDYSLINNAPITDLGLFSNETAIISHILTNQLPSGLYSFGFSASGGSAFLISLLKMNDHYKAALIAPETINYIHVSMMGEVIERKDLFFKDMVTLNDGFANPIVISPSTSPVDLSDYRDKWVILEFNYPGTPSSIDIYNANLPRKLEIIADFEGDGMNEFNLMGINVGASLLKKSTSPGTVSGSGTLTVTTGAGMTWRNLVFVVEKISEPIYDLGTAPTYREYFYSAGGDGPM
ncbi:MAG: hypothetical protein M0Q88_00975 [Bacilli bacterium]|nr:hypothetical protein [Bacilli bacterium]